MKNKKLKKLLHTEKKIYKNSENQEKWEKIIPQFKKIPTYSDDPISPKQLAFLKKYNYPEDYTRLTKEEASILIGAFIDKYWFEKYYKTKAKC